MLQYNQVSFKKPGTLKRVRSLKTDKMLFRDPRSQVPDPRSQIPMPAQVAQTWPGAGQDRLCSTENKSRLLSPKQQIFPLCYMSTGRLKWGSTNPNYMGTQVEETDYRECGNTQTIPRSFHFSETVVTYTHFGTSDPRWHRRLNCLGKGTEVFCMCDYLTKGFSISEPTSM